LLACVGRQKSGQGTKEPACSSRAATSASHVMHVLLRGPDLKIAQYAESKHRESMGTQSTPRERGEEKSLDTRKRDGLQVAPGARPTAPHFAEKWRND